MFSSDDGSCSGGSAEAENNGVGDLMAPQQNGPARIPNTPEILSALISINPMDTFMSQQAAVSSPVDDTDSCSVVSSSLDSPVSPTNPLNMRTLIKEDLKMRLRERRMRNRADSPQQQSQSHSREAAPQPHLPLEARYSSSGCDESGMDTEEDDGNLSNGDAGFNGCELTPEDEERRKRRRERNKLAAMKCRQKKREQTDKLEHESVNLESQNEKMKARIQELEGELQNLKMILQTHKPTCVNPSPEPTPVSDPAHPPSFQSTCSKSSNSGIMAGHTTTSQCATTNVAAQLPLPQPSFSSLDLPEFLLTSSPTTDDIFARNLAHLPQQGFLFG